jgi:hypothetical protein
MVVSRASYFNEEFKPFEEVSAAFCKDKHKDTREKSIDPSSNERNSRITGECEGWKVLVHTSEF